MNAAEDRILQLQAALDGELDAQGMLAFERACADDPQLAAEFARFKALDSALRDATPVEPAPSRLRARVAALAAPPRRSLRERFAERFAATPWREASNSTPWREAPNSKPWRAMAASLLIGVIAGAGALRLAPPPPDADRALVSAFVRTQIGGQSVDVVSSDRHVVKPWLAGRAPLATVALDLAASGFPLAGGRVEVIDGKVAPTLVYRRREHRIDVTELPLGRHEDRQTRLNSLDGYHVARWSDSDRAYVAVTDLPATELADFVMLFRRAAAGEREDVKQPGQ